MGRHKIRPKISMVQFGDEYQNTHVGLRQFELGVYDALSHFNVGNKATLLMYEKLGMTSGVNTINDLRGGSYKRISNAKCQCTDNSQYKRRLARALKREKGLMLVKKERSITLANGEHVTIINYNASIIVANSPSIYMLCC